MINFYKGAFTVLNFHFWSLRYSDHPKSVNVYSCLTFPCMIIRTVSIDGAMPLLSLPCTMVRSVAMSYIHTTRRKRVALYATMTVSLKIYVCLLSSFNLKIHKTNKNINTHLRKKHVLSLFHRMTFRIQIHCNVSFSHFLSGGTSFFPFLSFNFKLQKHLFAKMACNAKHYITSTSDQVFCLASQIMTVEMMKEFKHTQ